MQIDLSGKGLFVFSDPGGAKPVLSLVQSLERAAGNYKIISDREYSFYSSFSVKVDRPENLPDDELKSFAPDFIFAGTSYTSKIELNYIRAAKNAGIPCYAFVDHWTSIRERFNCNGQFVFPDKVLVIDQRARLIAVEEGIGEDLLEIFGNPYHRFLKNWKPAISKEEFVGKIGVGEGRRIAVYAPDPLSNINGSSTYGFDEISATTELNTVICELASHFDFLLNPHPNQDMDLLLPVLGPCMTVVPGGTDVNTLIYYSDVVIGFFSSFLIEASIMGKPVLRYFDSMPGKDPLQSMNVGKIVNTATIVSELNQLRWN